jgi:hypothetical protein
MVIQMENQRRDDLPETLIERKSGGKLANGKKSEKVLKIK